MAFKRANPSHEWWGFGVLFLIGTFVFLTISFFPMENITYDDEAKDVNIVEMEARLGFRIGSLFSFLAALFCFNVSRRKKAKEKEYTKFVLAKKSTAPEADISARDTPSTYPQNMSLNPQKNEKLTKLSTEYKLPVVFHNKIDFIRLIKLFFACFATHIASTILLAMAMLIFEFVSPLETILGLWAYLGWTLIFPVFWPIYSKMLR